MPKDTRNRRFMTVGFDPEEYLRIEQLAKAKDVSKTELAKDAVLYYLHEHDKILKQQEQQRLDGPVAEELKQFKQQVLRALKDLSFSVGQNIHLTGTILTEALPPDPQAMPEEEWKKLWDESKRYSFNYMKLVTKDLGEQDTDGDEKK